MSRNPSYKNIDISDLSYDADEFDLATFVSLCDAVNELHPEFDDDEITEMVFGDGDYFGNARKLGVDVDAIVKEEEEARIASKLETLRASFGEHPSFPFGKKGSCAGEVYHDDGEQKPWRVLFAYDTKCENFATAEEAQKAIEDYADKMDDEAMGE